MLPFLQARLRDQGGRGRTGVGVFPDLDRLGWTLSERVAKKRDGEYELEFVVYSNPSPQKF